MKKVSLSLFSGLLLTLVLLFSLSARAAPAEPRQGALRLESVTDRSATFVFRLPGLRLEQELIDGQDCDRLAAPVSAGGVWPSGLPGQPALLSTGTLLGMPLGASLDWEIEAVEWQELEGNYHLCPVLQPFTEMNQEGEPLSFGYRWMLDEDLYASDQAFPPSPVVLEPSGMIRSQPVASLTVHPVEYRPASGRIRWISDLRLKVDFILPAGQGSDQAAAGRMGTRGEGLFESTLKESTLFESTLQQLLPNYQQAQAWRMQPASSGQAEAAPPSESALPPYKILVKQSGLYQLSYADLQSAGLPVDSLDPRKFKISHTGSEVDIQVLGEQDGHFDAGDAILFYGEAMDTKYTDTNVYWLAWEGANGARMASLDGAPAGASVPSKYQTTDHLEEDLYYRNALPSGLEQDHWYWTSLNATSAAVTKTFTTTLSNISTQADNILVRGVINGFSASPNHRALISLNGVLLQDASWPAGSEYAFELPAQQSDLLEGENTITVEAVYGYGQTFLPNWFEIEYYDTYTAENDLLAFDGDSAATWQFQVDGFTTNTLDAYDITDPLHPLRILNAQASDLGGSYRLSFQQAITGERRYLALAPSQRLSPHAILPDTPSNLASTANGADYILITHASFLAQADQLAAHRQGQGLRTQVVELQDVFDEFSGGVYDPQAIHDFLAYAYQNWQPPAPAYVVLFGDGHYDFRDYFNYHDPNYMPPYLADVDPWYGETAADNRYVTVSGSDILPDMHLGRLPARSTSQAQIIVDNIIHYETTPPSGGWNSEVVYVADNPDSGGDFYTLSDSIIAQLPPAYTSGKVYYGSGSGSTHSSASAAKQAIKDAINQGRLMTNYIGHANSKAWTAEKIFETSDIASLTNTGKLTFSLPMTCFDGLYTNPNPSNQSIGETFLREGDKGAVASWSPTGQGVADGHDILESGLYEALFTNLEYRLGPASTYAKYYLKGITGAHDELVETYILFGDPATRLQALVEAPPQAPANLQATPVSSGQVDLAWQDNSSNETEFRIERSPDGISGWQLIAVVPADTTAYSDTSLACDTPYYYRVRAYRVGDDQFSTYSNVDGAVTYACWSLSFVPGWNLITLPLAPLSPYNAESLLVAINAQGGACSETVEWLNGGWNSHPLGLPFNLFGISLGEGYFVRCSQNSDWTLEGSKLTAGVSLNLVPGWNLVGIPYPPQGLTAQAVLDGVNGQGGSCQEIVRWINGGWESHPDKLPFNNFVILPTEGYFIRCTASSVYTP